LTKIDGRHQDGLTINFSQAGKPLIWDITVVSTLANSHVHLSSQSAGGTSRKTSKYADLPAAYVFQLLAFKTRGTTHLLAIDFLNAASGRSIAVTGNPRDTTFLEVYFLFYYSDLTTFSKPAVILART